MRVTLTEKELIAFEDGIAADFLAKKIHAPVHLAGGNEAILMGIFAQHVNPQDWVAVTWRSHYACLLKGVPQAELRKAIHDGKSINLNFPDHKIISSAICGGIAPIAVGLAMGIKRKRDAVSEHGMATNYDDWQKYNRKVVCFLGDMAARMGIVYEAMTYAINHKLPVLWIVENNNLSVATNTEEVWGGPLILQHESVIVYNYALTRPHVGVGQWVTF